MNSKPQAPPTSGTGAARLPRRRRRGVALLEVAVATVMLLVFFVFAAGGFPVAQRTAGTQARRTAASLYAHDHLDLLRCRDFASLASSQGNGPAEVPDPSPPVGGVRAPLRIYWDVAVKPADARPLLQSHLKDVAVTARWLQDGEWRSVTAQTLMGRCGP